MAEFVTADWESHVAEYDAGLVGSRRLMAWEVGLITADPDALRAKAAAQPHDPAFRPFAERALGAGVPVEVVSDGFGFFIEPALEALGVGGLPVVTAATTFGPAAPGSSSPTATRTASSAAPASATGSSRTRRPGGRWRSSATAPRIATPPATATSCSPRRPSSRSASPRAGRTTRWTSFTEIDAWLQRTLAAFEADPPSLAGPRHRPLFCGAEVWGPGRFDPA